MTETVSVALTLKIERLIKDHLVLQKRLASSGPAMFGITTIVLLIG